MWEDRPEVRGFPRPTLCFIGLRVEGDPVNEKGGKWVMTLAAKEDVNRLDEMWELLLLSMIGEYLDDGSADSGKDTRPAQGILRLVVADFFVASTDYFPPDASNLEALFASIQLSSPWRKWCNVRGVWLDLAVGAAYPPTTVLQVHSPGFMGQNIPSIISCIL